MNEDHSQPVFDDGTYKLYAPNRKMSNENNFSVASCASTNKIYNINYQNNKMRDHFEK